MSVVTCDSRIPTRASGKVHRVVVRPTMMYGFEMVALTKRQQADPEVAELIFIMSDQDGQD